MFSYISAFCEFLACRLWTRLDPVLVHGQDRYSDREWDAVSTVLSGWHHLRRCRESSLYQADDSRCNSGANSIFNSQFHLCLWLFMRSQQLQRFHNAILLWEINDFIKLMMVLLLHSGVSVSLLHRCSLLVIISWIFI